MVKDNERNPMETEETIRPQETPETEETAAPETAPEAEPVNDAAAEETEESEEPEVSEETEEGEEPETREEAEESETPEPVSSGERFSLGRALRSNKFKRGGMATLLSVVFIAIVVVLNIIVSLLAERFPSMNIDLTAQGLNTLSDQAVEIARGVEQDTTIYLIGDEDGYRKDRYYSSYMIKYSQVANLAERLREVNPRISVEFVDPDTNPRFISEYSTEGLGSGHVLVRTDKRYKILTAADMFTPQTDQSTGNITVTSKVDSALAEALEIVNLDNVPVLTVVTGHGEMLNGALTSFTEMMEKENFDVKEINIMSEEIPEDTQLLMLPTPTTDYTSEEIQKLWDYMNNSTREEDMAMLVTFHSTQGSLPNLKAFLEEWGIGIEEGVVVETDTSRMMLGSPTYVHVDAAEDVLTDGNYPNLVAMQSVAMTQLFTGNGSIATKALWNTADSAYILAGDAEELPEDPETDTHIVAALSSMLQEVGPGTKYDRNLVVFGSSAIFVDGYVDASAFSNGKFITDLLKAVTGTDGSTVTVKPESVTTGSLDISASQGTIDLLGLGVFTVGLPLVILVAGLVIFLKRRHL